jgi:hypothetical protein
MLKAIHFTSHSFNATEQFSHAITFPTTLFAAAGAIGRIALSQSITLGNLRILAAWEFIYVDIMLSFK